MAVESEYYYWPTNTPPWTVDSQFRAHIYTSTIGNNALALSCKFVAIIYNVKLLLQQFMQNWWCFGHCQPTIGGPTHKQLYTQTGICGQITINTHKYVFLKFHLFLYLLVYCSFLTQSHTSESFSYIYVHIRSWHTIQTAIHLCI